MTQVAAAPAESRRLSAPGDPEELGALFESYLRLLRVTSTPWRLRLRFCPGLHRIAVEHVRRSTDALLCHFHGRLARGEDPQSEEACERLESLSHSLPAERSGLWPLLPVIAIVVLAEALAPICASAPVIKRVHEMSEVTELDVTHTSAAVNMLLHSSVQAVL